MDNKKLREEYNKLLEENIVYNQDPYRLFFEGVEERNKKDIKRVQRNMRLIQAKHTYEDRVENILRFI